MKREIRKTADQSPTLYVESLDEHYHSVHGALQESQHVFLQAGLAQFAPQQELHLLEMGLGTGLNALLSALAAEQAQRLLHYHGVEKYPLEAKEWQALDYAVHCQSPDLAQELYHKIHGAEWQQWQAISPHFKLYKEQEDFLNLSLPTAHYDLIYFDAFAPSAQAELWTAELFGTLAQALKPEGILVTYCVKGSVRRAMQSAGLQVEKIPGPPGKREMSRARKIPAEHVQ